MCDQLSELKKQITSLQKSIVKKDNQIKKFKKLIDVNSIISSTLNKKEVLQRITKQTKNLLDCKKCSILLIDPDKNRLIFNFLSVKSEKSVLKGIELKKGEGIAGKVWEHGKPMLIKDARNDPHFSNKADAKTSFTTTSLIAIPLIVNERIIGVMEAINKNKNLLFNNEDMKLFQELGIQAAIAILNAELYEMATTDHLTKLFIRRFFINRLDEEYSRATRYKHDLSLIMFDFDHFKHINDNYGHQCGDLVLTQTCKLIKKSCRKVDLSCRYGGEEIAVLLPETNIEQANKFAERLRIKIQGMTFNYNKKKISITISGGISSLKHNKPRTWEELFENADKALYQSKKNGRNRITLYEAD